MANNESTVALSLIIHGEAVRFNRGKGQADGFDFKYMSGKGGVFPYVSSQCFKKYWRQNVPQPFSPIQRGKNSAGVEKNQVYTEANPLVYVDDDLFGYMRAGANTEEAQGDISQGDSTPDQDDALIESFLLDKDNVKDKNALLDKFKKGKGDFYQKLQQSVSGEVAEEYNQASRGGFSNALLDALIASLNDAIQNPSDSNYKLKPDEKKAVEIGTKSYSQVVSDYVRVEFVKALQPPQPTTKRTAPIRMHALVAFSGISTAKDFQTFARDITYTGKNAVLNPNPVGIYSGWLKTRILIEGQRIGEFYLGENRDILLDHISRLGEKAPEIQTKIDPYSREHKPIDFVKLNAETRINRMQSALLALANIGNLQGPASGALHDGSLRPKGFIGAFMNCADSPFDAVWLGTDDLPYLDVSKLKAMLLDWEDLFASRIVYIGYPVEMRFSPHQLTETLTGSDMREVADLGFTFIVDTPRRALLKMTEDVAA